jgi:hypothetical protein
MAGGIFVDQPFYLNPKCVVISIFCMICYWFLPYRNFFMLPVIFSVSYILIAWYDYIYNCDMKMYSGTSPLNITSWAKPQMRNRKEENENNKVILSKNQESVYKKKVYALHFLFIAPLLFYLGIYKNKSNKNIWSVVGAMSIIILMYHGMRLFYPREISDMTDVDEKQRLFIVYLFHIIFIFPLFFYIYWFKDKSSKKIWTPILILSVFVFLYHFSKFILIKLKIN